jgi:uncharacterized cupredoxin-like copper-binding protein
MRLRSIAFLLTAVLGLSLAGIAAAHPAAQKATTVRVVAKDYKFVLSTKTVRHGRITFDIKNEGATNHDFKIDEYRSKMIKPGTSTTMTVTLKAGKYHYMCSVDSHAKLGMRGTLRVT